MRFLLAKVDSNPSTSDSTINHEIVQEQSPSTHTEIENENQHIQGPVEILPEDNSDTNNMRGRYNAAIKVSHATKIVLKQL